jgi:hypothetical protein
VDWLEQNLDAYRIIAEILNDLRRVLRLQLETAHGKNWYKSGLPDGLLDRLIDIKEKEKAIDWYESEYQQIMDYAVFPDLLQILEHSADGFPQIMRLAPTSALLHARFLELEVMRAKLGRARPISDTELAFLGTFHLRFRKAIEEFQVQQPAAKAPTAESSRASTTEVPDNAVSVADPDVEIADIASTEAEPLEDEDSGPPRRRATTPTGVPKPDGDASSDEPPNADDEKQVQAQDADVEGDGDGDHDKKNEEPDVNAIDAALEKGDDVGVLREIYREVTSTAEGLWTRDVLPSHRIWNKVSTSTWYEENFSRLGLKPVSDYYEILS